MAQRGHEVKVFTTSINAKDCLQEYEKVELHRYGTIIRYKKGAISPKLFWDPLSFDIDLVHAHFATPAAEIAAIRCSKAKKVPLIITYHGDMREIGSFASKAITFLYNKLLLNWVMSQAKLIICHSPYYVEESRVLGKYKDKIAIVATGVNIEDFKLQYSRRACKTQLGFSPDCNILLFMGNLFPSKGPDVLIKAMPRILKSFPNTRLVLAGKGILEQELKELAKKLGLEEYIRFPGFVTGSLKSRYYQAADVFALPSTMETEVLPIVLLEASAAGVPMVVSDLQTFRCIVEDGYNGLITKKGNEDELAHAIVLLLENQSLRDKMGENARGKVKDYSWDEIAEQTERVYKEVLKSCASA